MATIDLDKLPDALDTYLGDASEGSLLQQIIIDWWNKKVIPPIWANLDNKNINASSVLRQSFVPGQITKSPTSINTILLAEDYWEFVEYGRKPTRNGHIEGTPYLWQSIAEWMAFKAVKPPEDFTYDSYAKAIARKIHRVGTKPKPFLESAFTESIQMELVNELNARFGDLIFSEDIKL
jgi:hypothetical protein